MSCYLDKVDEDGVTCLTVIVCADVNAAREQAIEFGALSNAYQKNTHARRVELSRKRTSLSCATRLRDRLGDSTRLLMHSPPLPLTSEAALRSAEAACPAAERRGRLDLVALAVGKFCSTDGLPLILLRQDTLA